jgi:hypothetical protein
MRVRAFLTVLVLAALASACGDASSDIPPIPASHHPKGEDITVGTVLAATENSGGVRLNKVIFVDDYPPPLDYEFHMVAYDPKAQTWEEAARMWKKKQVSVIIQHFTVRRTDFLTRDYRVLFKEDVTPEEKAVYEASKNRYPIPPRPPPQPADSATSAP